MEFGVRGSLGVVWCVASLCGAQRSEEGKTRIRMSDGWEAIR